MPVPSRSDDSEAFDGLVPLIVGVTGHRDLVVAEIPAIRDRVRSFFRLLQAKFADRPLLIMSPLAEGADRLVAVEALDMGIRLAVPLPMPREIYVTDFETEESRREFDDLCRRAEAVYELPTARRSRVEDLVEHGPARDLQYAQLGIFLCAHSHIVLAIWDGKPSRVIGGTAQVVSFHHDDVMAGYEESDAVSQQLLADDESDLVYHIVVSRDRRGGEPRTGLKALSCTWYTTDPFEPRSGELPEKYVRIFERTNEFNREAKLHAEAIVEQCYPLIEPDSDIQLPSETEIINRLFCAADWLAIHFQKQLHGVYRIVHVMMFLMGMMFLLYSDLEAREYFMYTLVVCLVVAVAANQVAARGRWHSKYLEYRALAEGLRVQFYWAVAGVSSDRATKYSHDNFLQKQDVELGWIRNVMRVAGIGCDVARYKDPAALEFVIREWIGNETVGGQLKYYRTKAGQYMVHSVQIQRLGQVIGISVPILLVSMFVVSSDGIRNNLFLVLGALLLLLSVRQSFAFRVAEKEVIKQYDFMYRIFGNARRRLDNVATDEDRRRILRALGDAALDEHAEWILLHRDRPLEQDSLWRMEV